MINLYVNIRMIEDLFDLRMIEKSVRTRPIFKTRLPSYEEIFMS